MSIPTCRERERAERERLIVAAARELAEPDRPFRRLTRPAPPGERRGR
jgi:hypothetical protein